MADKSRYPQIPSTVWWGTRSILNKTPNATLDERFLAVQLKVQEAAAKAYINELISVGILNDEKKATPLAHRWRLDPSYSEAVIELVERNYPEGLRHVSPPSEGDRSKAIHWFQSEGLGQGAAGNKAATYFMIGSPTPNDSPVKSAGKPNTNGSETKGGSRERTASVKTKDLRAKVKVGDEQPSQMPLNINLQIHISADAGTEQIEAIFSAMKRYLHDQQDS